MNLSKRKRLEAAGWRIGSAQDFLRLSDHEATFVDLKLRLAKALAARRAKDRLTQSQVAKLLKSSQSRVAKLEAGDPSVSADLHLPRRPRRCPRRSPSPTGSQAVNPG